MPQPLSDHVAGSLESPLGFATIASALFKAAVSGRARLYRSGLLPTRSLRDAVVSVGNLTVGGTGKTPYVAYLARLLKKHGHQPCILSRGYGGRAENSNLLVSEGEGPLCGVDECGDEPFLLASKLPGVIVAVGKDRHKSGSMVEQRWEKVVHILDDGFQRLSLKRDLNILLLDGTDPFGGGRLLPAGRLREPLAALARADLVVVTRAHFALDFDEIELQIRSRNPLVPISYFHHEAVSFHDLKTGRRHPVREFLNRPAVALAAVGNPEVLLHDLAHYQIRVTERHLYRDHHNFTQAELDKAVRAAGGDSPVITTEKDAVRLQRLQFEAGAIMVFEIEAVPGEPEEYERFILNEIEALPGVKGKLA